MNNQIILHKFIGMTTYGAESYGFLFADGKFISFSTSEEYDKYKVGDIYKKKKLRIG